GADAVQPQGGGLVGDRGAARLGGGLGRPDRVHVALGARERVVDLVTGVARVAATGVAASGVAAARVTATGVAAARVTATGVAAARVAGAVIGHTVQGERGGDVVVARVGAVEPELDAAVGGHGAVVRGVAHRHVLAGLRVGAVLQVG